jgi:ubiquinone/menaquinone biosynthesis C-methylase UbiE
MPDPINKKRGGSPRIRQRAKVGKSGGIFTKTARFYDAVYAAIGKDYASEAHELNTLIERMVPDARILLDIGCGTGGHLPHFAERFETHAIDADGQMLAIARQRHPTVEVQHGDISTFSHDRQYDVITCLFSAVAYTRTINRLHAAIANIAHHLAPGGILIVEPFVDPRSYHPASFPAVFIDLPDLKIARMSSAKRVNDVAMLDFQYLVMTTAGVEHHIERHKLGLFTAEVYREAFLSAGLQFSVSPNETPTPTFDRGLYIGRR